MSWIHRWISLKQHEWASDAKPWDSDSALFLTGHRLNLGLVLTRISSASWLHGATLLSKSHGIINLNEE